jgi:hypothetical protein
MRKLWFACAAAFAAMCGCSRLPDATYTLRADAEKLELPQKHKAQIAAYLAAFHGTPANPRMALPAEGAEPPEATPAASPSGAAVIPAVARVDKPGYDRLHLQLAVRRLPRHDR